MTNTGQLDFLDLISIMSFVIALMNLDENMTQGDKQELLEKFSSKADSLLSEIHEHLEEQDIKLDLIMEELRNGTERNIQ